MALKEYRHKGVCPIIVEGYGRVNPGTPSFVCEMDPYWENSFLTNGSIEILDENTKKAKTKPSVPKPWPGGLQNPADVKPWPGRDAEGNLTLDGRRYDPEEKG